jgi:ubiquinone/menaquinone biosynthesis C-methylase UbiE
MASVPSTIPGDIDVVSTRDGYDRWAKIYDDEENPLILLEEAQIEDLIGDVSGLTVADIGCGTGRNALRLAATGAAVTAIDYSEAMLRRARAKPGENLIRFLQHDLDKCLPLDDEAFNLVLCYLVIDHIADLESFFRELKRICKKDGFIVASVMHPAMMLRGVQARFTDPATGRETRPLSYPHQISDYVMAATRVGLVFDHLSEHAVDDDLAERSPRARKHLGWPLLLLMRLRAMTVESKTSA